MSRRGFLTASARAGLGVTGLAALLEGCSSAVHLSPTGPSRGGVTNLIIDGARAWFFAGGITRQSDGSYYLVYQYKPFAGNDYIRGRRLPSLSAPAGPEEVCFDGVSIDPSVTTLPTGETLVLVHHGAANWLTVRRPDGSFSALTEVGPAGESMISRAGERVFIAYKQAGVESATWIPVLAREIYSPTTFGPPVDTGARTGAMTPSGMHAQKRSSIGGIGASDVLLAWDQPRTPSGGIRSIWVARSQDGTTWTSHQEVASNGRDLRNAFVLQIDQDQTRVYYEAGGGQIGLVLTADGGRTWTEPVIASMPRAVTGASRVSLFVHDGSIYCFSGWQTKGGGNLGIFGVGSAAP